MVHLRTIASDQTLMIDQERRWWRLTGIFIGNFEHISYLTGISIVDFEQVNVSWFVA